VAPPAVSCAPVEPLVTHSAEVPTTSGEVSAVMLVRAEAAAGLPIWPTFATSRMVPSAS
jgi:hypothetical protein